VTFVQSQEDEDGLIERFKLWTEGLVRVRLQKSACCSRLAELGIITSVPPVVDPGDRPRVMRIKEELLTAVRESERIRGAMAKMGAEILDEESLEVLFPGGPEPGSFLSWIPGEPRVGWWRAGRDGASSRERLPGVSRTACEPTAH
jgi:hypothetical protein